MTRAPDLGLLSVLIFGSTLGLLMSVYFLRLWVDAEAVVGAAYHGAQEEGGAPAGTLVVVLELLCFCVTRHAMRVKYFILRNQCMEAVLKLMGRREAWLAVAAVRFLRTCIGLKVRLFTSGSI